VLACAAACTALFEAGCSTTGGSSSAIGHYSVRVKTPLYRYGPAQSFGPDFSLEPGRHVIMLSKEFGYSRVMTDDGQSGYVATEDLVAAPPPPAPPKTSSGSSRPLFAKKRGSSRSSVSSASGPVMQGAPLFGEGELPPLPQNDPLQPPSKPGFRVNVPAPTPTPAANPEQKKGKPGFRARVPSEESGQ
jgi:hypothetical protein